MALRFLALVLAPFTIGLVLLGPDLLRLWLGAEYARMGGTALRLLAVGAFANALAYIPFAFLQGINRPDLPAKFHVLELPLFLIVAAALIPRFGVSGAGAAWAVRAVADAALLLRAAATQGASLSSGRSIATWGWAAAFGVCLTTGFLPTWPALGVGLRVVIALVAGGLLLGGGWIALLSPERRAQVRAALQRLEPAGR